MYVISGPCGDSASPASPLPLLAMHSERRSIILVGKSEELVLETFQKAAHGSRLCGPSRLVLGGASHMSS